MGNYERLCPCDESEALFKLIGGQKMFGSQSKVSERIPDKSIKIYGPGSMPNVSLRQGGASAAAAPSNDKT
jgi:hypothetical protein